MVKGLALVLAIGGMWRLKRSGLALKDAKDWLKNVVRGSWANLMQLWAAYSKALSS